MVIFSIRKLFLQELLARQPSSVEKSDQPRKAKLPGKWDAIMISIAEGQKRKTDLELADRYCEKLTSSFFKMKLNCSLTKIFVHHLEFVR
jgi:hypothetical protein